MRRLSKLFIGREFIGGVSEKAVRLSINPVTMLLGKQVFDADGKLLGKVVNVVRKGSINTFSAIDVKRRIYSRGMRIPKDEIDVSKKNIILKKIYE
jgi:sporulation protein YlmC with PRC-barrel domain